MKTFNDIISNGKLQILTQVQESDVTQIRAYYTDPITRKRYWCKFTSAYGWEHLTVSPQPQRGKTPEWDSVSCTGISSLRIFSGMKKKLASNIIHVSLNMLITMNVVYIFGVRLTKLFRNHPQFCWVFPILVQKKPAR